MEGFKSKVENAVAAGIIATGLAASPEAHAGTRSLEQHEKNIVMQDAQNALDAIMTENADGTYSMKSGDVEIIVKIDKQTIRVYEQTEKVEMREETVNVGVPKL